MNGRVQGGGAAIPLAVRRAASFLPSATAWAYALGLDSGLACVTSTCEAPGKPVCVRSILDGKALTAAEVDHAVHDALLQGRPLHRLDARVLREADPDVVFTQSLCDACGPSHPHVEEAAALLGRRPRVVALAPRTLPEALDDALLVADALGAPERGVRLRAALQARLDALRTALGDRPRPRVALLEWTGPPMRCGHWFPDVVRAAGGEEVLGTPGGKSVPLAWDEVADARPDLVLVAPCGFTLAQARREADAVAARLPRVPIVAVDGNLLSRPGPTLVDAAETLAHVLHPTLRPPAPTAATAWCRIR